MLIELSPKLLETSIRYGNNIAIWANKVETRYKEFFNIMSKVQLSHGMQLTNNNFTNSMSSLASNASSISLPSQNNSLILVNSTSGYDTGSNNSTITLNEQIPTLQVKNTKSQKLKQKIAGACRQCE